MLNLLWFLKKTFWLQVGLLFGIYEEQSGDIIIKETGEVIHDEKQKTWYTSCHYSLDHGNHKDYPVYPTSCDFKFKDLWKHSRFGGRNW